MRYLILIVLSIFFIGCASIIHGSRQDISVLSSPLGARVTINSINVSTTTPGVINLARKTSSYVLRFEKEGYEPVEVKLTRATDGWVWGNIVFGGLIGIAIDFSSGSAYKLTPEAVEVALREIGKQSRSDNKENSNLLVYVDLEQIRK